MIFFDSYAILEIIKGNPSYEKFMELTFITNTLNLTEVFYSLLKETDRETINFILGKFNFEYLEIDEDIAIKSAIFRYNNKLKKLSYTDCIGYVTAQKYNLKFLTGDKEFQRMNNVEFVK